MIHVCYGLHDKDGRYSKFTGTSMLSLFENVSYPPPSVVVHILHDNTLTQDNCDKFVYIAGRYGQAVRFYNVEQLCANEISYFKEMNLVYTVGSIFRFMILNLFPKEIEKIIYLDSDVIINLDIKTLWEIDIGDKPLAAVPEIANESIDPQLFFPICREGFVKGENYFNSGVMVMNLERLRREEETLKKDLPFKVNTRDTFILTRMF